MKMKQIAVAIGLVFGTAFVFADEAEMRATGNESATSPTPQQGQPAGTSTGDKTADGFWKENAKSGYLHEDQVKRYKDKSGKSVDFKKLDANADKRATQDEWVTYHRVVINRPLGVVVSPIATTYWVENEKKGYMARNKAMEFRGADGKPPDWDKLDSDGDGRASHSEWITYHDQSAVKSGGARDSGVGGRAGAAGPVSK